MLADLSRRGGSLERAAQMSWPDYLRLWEQFGYNGVQYVIPGGNLGELTAMQAQRNPIVWALISFRLLVFSEIRFQFQSTNYMAPADGKRFGNPSLSILENPWPNATTGDLLARMEVDASMYGNCYFVKSPDGKQLVRLNPTRVTIATTDAVDQITGKPYGKELVGYILHDEKNHVASVFLPAEVAHYKPVADPANEFRGASWLNALLPDVIADLDLTDYKHAFLQNAATPNLAMIFPPQVKQEAFDKFKDKMESAHTGPQSGFKTLYLGGGVDVKTVGSNFNDLAMDAVQSAGETRMAAAAGVPPGLVGLSESLKGSTLNSGNYAATRRRFSDGTMRPLWRSACAALSIICPPPGNARLWYDDSDVSFLQEDRTDEAEIRGQDAKTILSLVQAGYTPESVIVAVRTGDFSSLEHTGLVSVQLQKSTPVPAGGLNPPDPTIDNDPPQAPALPPGPTDPDPEVTP